MAAKATTAAKATDSVPSRSYSGPEKHAHVETNSRDQLLAIRGLHKTYGGSVHALRGVDITFRRGEFVVIIGPSGAGKSTLIRCINRLVEPDRGEVVFDGEHLESLKGGELRRRRAMIGMVFQHYNLIGRVNVINNVLHGRLGHVPVWRSALGMYSHEDRAAAVELLQTVGLDEQMYKRADELSGGQMQRVGICRALIQNPKLLLADEPIASLDPRSADVVMDTIRTTTEARHLTCIVNLHQVDYARRYASRIIGLKHGTVVFDGHPDELDAETSARIYEGHEDQMFLQADGADSAEEAVTHG